MHQPDPLGRQHDARLPKPDHPSVRDGSLALVFRLTHGRYIVGYALGDDGMFFRGELLTECDEERPATKPSNSLSTGRRSTKRMKPTPGMGSPTRLTPRLVKGHGWGGAMTAPPDTTMKA